MARRVQPQPRDSSGRFKPKDGGGPAAPPAPPASTEPDEVPVHRATVPDDPAPSPAPRARKRTAGAGKKRPARTEEPPAAPEPPAEPTEPPRKRLGFLDGLRAPMGFGG